MQANHTFKTFAKINLFLHILGRREDNYHELESIFYFTDCYDEISFSEVKTNEVTSKIELKGRFADELKNSDLSENSIIKAYKILQEFSQNKLPNLKFTLTKNLPISSGIGAGSSNAAGVIRELNNFYQLNIANEILENLALKIGADVPACLYSKPLIARGVGEKISLINNFAKLNILLINPLIQVSTKEIFKMGFTKFSNPVNYKNSDFTDVNSLINFLKNTQNDLQKNAIKICPEIREILEYLPKLKGFLIARMSGSGATCFAIFDSEKNLSIAREKTQEKFPNYWLAFSSPGKT